MNRTKESFIFGFAIFVCFFGAGNLILPPLLGFNAGPDWWLVAFGFVLSATVIPCIITLFACPASRYHVGIRQQGVSHI